MARADDITVPVVVPKREVIAECTTGLSRYLADLAEQIPKVVELDDYRECVHKLESMTAHVNA